VAKPGSHDIADVNGTMLEYEAVGDGPAVVLLHGLTLDRRMWDDQIDALSAAHRVLRYDLRGFGQPADPRVGEEYTHADDLRGLLAHLDIPSATVAGLSMGGWIALEFTLTYPRRCGRAGARRRGGAPLSVSRGVGGQTLRG